MKREEAEEKEEEEEERQENGDIHASTTEQDKPSTVRDSMISATESEAQSHIDLTDKVALTPDVEPEVEDKVEEAQNTSTPVKTSSSSCCQLQDDGRLLSGMYAAVLVLLGVVFPVSEALRGQWLVEIPSGVFLVYLFGMSIVAIVTLEIVLYRQARNEQDITESDVNMKEEPRATFISYTNASYDGELSIVTGRSPALSMSDVSHKTAPGELMRGQSYVIGSPHESQVIMPHHTSLYLRIGTVVFGLGSMIYVGLLLKQLHEETSPSACASPNSLVWPYYVMLAYLLAQTYFIIKHGQMDVVSSLPLVRLCLIHLLATNWCLWMRTLVREIIDALIRHQDVGPVPSVYPSYTSPVSSNYSNVTGTMRPEITSTVMNCSIGDDIFWNASPYLFPCVLEYSILAAAHLYSMYTDVGYRLLQSNSQTDEHNIEPVYSWTEVNFHKTHKGLFLGIVVFAATCVSIIMFFSYLGTSEKDTVSMIIYHVSDLGLHALLIGACVSGWLQVRKLSNIPGHLLSVPQWVLLVAMCGLLLYHMFKTYAVFLLLDIASPDVVVVLGLCGSVLSMVLAVFQTSFIMDAMGRISTTVKNLQDKPGRGSITFLLIANISMWAFRTLQLKEAEIEEDYEEQLFGFLSWSILMYGFVPLLVFYYYQASACLAQTWSDAYRRDTLKEPLPDPVKEEGEGEGDQKDWTAYDRSSSPVRLIELRRRVKKGSHLVQEVETILSPVSEV